MNLEVVTPQGTTLATDADEVTAPGARGEFGVLPGHTPFVAALKPGVLTFRDKQKRGVLAVGAGYAEVNGHDRVVVLVQRAEQAESIDSARAQKELEETERALKDWKQGDAGSRGELERKRDWLASKLDAHAVLVKQRGA